MDEVESDEEVRLQVVGWPCLGLLDTLTVEVRTPWGTARKYQCAGAGCQAMGTMNNCTCICARKEMFEVDRGAASPCFFSKC